MKKSQSAQLMLLALALTLSAHPVASQSWPTIGGNNQKNGRSEITGPQSLAQYWSITSTNTTLWGNSVYTFGDMFVQSRVVFTPSYTAKVELRGLTTGELIWEQQVNPDAILYAVGLTEDAVYAADYDSGILYSLNIADGSVRWSVSTTMFPGNTGLVYACNGDPIEFGKRMNRDTGEILWTNDYPIPVGPDGGYVVVGNTYYHWTGYINTDKTLIAIDTETGGTMYVSKALPGDGDQENDLVAGPDGTIYITRDGGALYAFKDDGTGFTEKWSRSPGPLVKAVGWDGTLYAASAVDNNLIRLDPNSGATLDSVQTPVNVLSGYISVGADSTIYVATGESNGRYIALSPDLQIVKWEIAVPYNYYSGPALAKDGVLVTVGAGTAITAYKTDQPLKPVADFRADERRIVAGAVAYFHDQSSFSPDVWAWSFPGASTPSSTDPNPEIAYFVPGVYDVSLIASNSLGSDSISKSCYVEVLPSTGVAEHPDDVPDEFQLFQNFPNPFNPETDIRYSIPSSGTRSRPDGSRDGQITDDGLVTLKIFDLLGREVVTLVNEMKAPGTYTVKWDASGFSSGVYVYRLRAGSSVASRKLIVQK